MAAIGTTHVGTTTNYNKYFGVPHFTGREYYAGHYSTNNNNHFDFFSAGGLDFVVLYFEYNTDPPAELLAWANQVLATNAWRRAIVVTHNMGNTDDARHLQRPGLSPLQRAQGQHEPVSDAGRPCHWAGGAAGHV